MGNRVWNRTEVGKARWLAAMCWRRKVELALAGSGLTFTQWLILAALHELIESTEDAVSQNDVCARLELDRGTVSLVMRTLEQKGLVDRGPDMTCRAWRIFLTSRAEILLRDRAEGIEGASASSHAHFSRF